MTIVEQNLIDTKLYVENEQVILPMATICLFLALGTLSLQHQTLTLSNAYLVPQLSANLISVGQVGDNGYLVQFGCEYRNGELKR